MRPLRSVALLSLIASLTTIYPLSLRAGPPQYGGNLKYQRVIAIVPPTGSGTFQDPTRPLYCPNPHAPAAAAAGPPTILGCQAVLTDNGQSYIVEYAAVNRVSLQPILQSTVPGVTVLDGSTMTAAQIQAAIQSVKASFSLDQFHGAPAPAAGGAQ
jgi:hypothetical protein